VLFVRQRFKFLFLIRAFCVKSTGIGKTVNQLRKQFPVAKKLVVKWKKVIADTPPEALNSAEKAVEPGEVETPTILQTFVAAAPNNSSNLFLFASVLIIYRNPKFVRVVHEDLRGECRFDIRSSRSSCSRIVKCDSSMRNPCDSASNSEQHPTDCHLYRTYLANSLHNTF
jgi:hypothetical protein